MPYYQDAACGEQAMPEPPVDNELREHLLMRCKAESRITKAEYELELYGRVHAACLAALEQLDSNQPNCNPVPGY